MISKPGTYRHLAATILEAIPSAHWEESEFTDEIVIFTGMKFKKENPNPDLWEMESLTERGGVSE